MKKNLEAIILLILIVVVILATVWNSIKSSFERKTYKKGINTKQLLISTAKARYMNFNKTARWYGKVQAKQNIPIISPITAKVVWVSKRNEDFVKKGAVLFKLGGKIVKMRINSLKNTVENLKKQVSLQKRIVKLKRLSFKNRLIKKSELIAAIEKLQNIKYQLKISLDKLKTLKSLTVIKSPIDGFFKRTVCRGQFVSKGSVLGEVISSKLRIVGYAFVDEPELLIGKEIIEDEKPIGIVTKVLPVKRNDGAEIFWADTMSGGLYAGETLTGKIELGNFKALAIPEEAVAYDENGLPTAFIKTDKGYKKIIVKVGQTQNGWVQVIKGLKAGDTVVTKGSYELLYKNFSKIFKASD